MFDIRWIRENPGAFDEGLRKRGLEPLSAQALELDSRRREAETSAQELQARRNAASKEIGALKAKGEDAQAKIDEVARLKDELGRLEDAAREAEAALAEFLSGIPNLPDDDVPEGADEAANVELRQWGGKPDFGFEPREHFALGEALGAMDFERAAKLAGSRFVVLTGPLARLERALAQFMIDIHTQEFGYTEVYPPVLVRDEALYGTGQLPKFAEDLFRTSSPDWIRIGDWVQDALNKEINSLIDIRPPGEDFSEDLNKLNRRAIELFQEAASRREFEERRWLIPTAEVPLTNMVADEIVDEAALPLRFTALTPCFRAEAGAAGKDTRGMLRQHQFEKVELVSIAHPDRSAEEHERMTGCAEAILQRLDIHYRVMALSTGDMGFAARKTYDIEAWLPGQGLYREISSCSNCGEFQARRMKARFKPREGKGNRHVHTLNGSGLAVGRTLIALMENHQREDGSIAIPEALRPYLGGLDRIGP